MKEDAHLELWTRMLEGESLSDEESAALDGFLLSADPETQTRLQQDLRQAQALRAAFSSHVENDAFVQSVVDQIKQGPVTRPPVPPPIVATPTVRREVHLESAARRSESSTASVWVFAAVACTVLLLCGISFVALSGDEQTGHPTESEKVAVVPPVTPSNDRPATLESPREGLVIDQQEDPNELFAPRTQESKPPASDTVESPTKVVQAQPKSDQTPQKDPVQLVPQGSPSMQTAVLAKSSDAVWADNRKPDPELMQPIDLVSGTASIKLAKGAVLDFTGPTQLQVMGPNKAALLAGTAQVHVPKPAVGFEISVAGARIVDLGTRFSVSSQPTSKFTIVTVTEGKVEAFQPPINRRARERKTRLVAGKTKWFPKEGTERAYDWVLKIDFEFGNTAPEKITIADTEFDLTDFGSATRAKLALNEQFDFAHAQLALVERGERFRGLLIYNRTEQSVDNKKQLTAIKSFLIDQLSKTSVGSMNPLQMMQEMQQRMKSLMQQP